MKNYWLDRKKQDDCGLSKKASLQKKYWQPLINRLKKSLAAKQKP